MEQAICGRRYLLRRLPLVGQCRQMQAAPYIDKNERLLLGSVADMLIGYTKPGVLPPGKPPNEMVVALERGRAKLCLNCDLKKCVNCYESRDIKTRRKMFHKALEMKIPEDLARKMFVRGDIL